MELKELIDRYINEQKNYQGWVDSYQIKLEALFDMTQPTAEEFYENITSDKFYTTSLESKRYEYILGGDGRSSAWSEWRDGIVLTVKVRSEFYLPNELITALTNYIKEKFNGQYTHLEMESIRLTSFK
jgi:hypothetical protein